MEISAVPGVVASGDTLCPMCGASETKALFVATDRNRGTGGEFPVVVCLTCGSWFQLHPLLGAQLAERYPERYYAASRTTEGGSVLLELASKSLVRLHRFRGPPGKLLDVGCKSGELVRVARDCGWEAMGVELSPDAAAIGRRAYDVEIIEGDFLEARLPSGSFDVVTMYHVLEHLPEPVQALTQAVGLLAPGGVLVVATPNPASLGARLFGARWYHLDVPRHLVLAPPGSLTTRLEEMGMTVLGLNYSIPAHNWVGIFSSIINPQRIRAGRLLPRRGGGLLRNVLRYIAKSPFELAASAEAALRCAETYEVYATKTS